MTQTTSPLKPVFPDLDPGAHSHPACLSLGVPSLQWLSEGQTEASLSQRAEDGKTELSLMRFSLAHPQWQPPGHSSKFLGHLRGRVQQDAAAWGAPSTRSPPTPGMLSNCTSPLVSSRSAYSFALPTLHRPLAFDFGLPRQPISCPPLDLPLSHTLLFGFLYTIVSLLFSQKPSWPTSW